MNVLNRRILEGCGGHPGESSPAPGPGVIERGRGGWFPEAAGRPLISGKSALGLSHGPQGSSLPPAPGGGSGLRVVGESRMTPHKLSWGGCSPGSAMGRKEAKLDFRSGDVQRREPVILHFTLVETHCHPVTAIQPRPGGSQNSSRALRSFCLAPTAASLCAGLPAGESVNLTGLHRSGPGERSERVCAHGWLCAQPPDSS